VPRVIGEEGHPQRGKEEWEFEKGVPASQERGLHSRGKSEKILLGACRS